MVGVPVAEGGKTVVCGGEEGLGSSVEVDGGAGPVGGLTSVLTSILFLGILGS